MTDVTQVLMQFVEKLISNRPTALAFADDPQGVMAEEGLNEYDMQGLDMPGIVQQACNTYGLPSGPLQNYTNGGGGGGGAVQPPPPGPTQGMGDVVQHLTYVTYETHQGDTEITQTILDQSTDIEIHGDSNAPIDVHNAAATAEDAVANSGDGDVNQASGDNSQVISESTVGQNQVNSDGAVQVTGGNEAPIVTGENRGVIFDDAHGSVEDIAVGNTGPVFQNDAPIDGPIAFGGDATEIENSSLNQSNIGDGNETHVVQGNTVGQGGALSGEGNATGSYHVEDNDTTTTTNDNDITTTTNDNDVTTTVNEVDNIAAQGDVAVEHGYGDQHSDQSHTEVEEPEQPKELVEDMGS